MPISLLTKSKLPKLTGQLGVPNSAASTETNAPAVAKNPSGNAITNWAHLMVLDQSNIARQFPAKVVPAGMAVRVRANNGTNANNQNVIFVGLYPDAFKGGHGVPLAPLDDVLYPIDNTGKLWIYGGAGDGVVVSIITPAGN